MIGQEKLENTLYELIDNNTIPRFIILTGAKGSGRKTLARLVAKKLNAQLFEPTEKTSVEYIRDVIEQCYKQTTPTVYLIPDADAISNQAENALLKICEEPPNNSYIIMTAQSLKYLLNTIRSRATCYRLATYSIDTLSKIAKEHNIEFKNNVYETLNTPGAIIDFADGTNIYSNLETFVNLVIDNIGDVSGANALKMSDRISFKEDETGFNLASFWILFNNVAMQRTKDIKNSKRNMYFSYIRVTGEYQAKLTIQGINKKSLFDLWVLEIRQIYNKYN